MSFGPTLLAAVQPALHDVASACAPPVGSCAAATTPSLLGAAALALLGAMGRAFDSAAAWLLVRVGDALVTSSAPPLGTPWFAAHVHLFEELAGFVVLPLLLVAVIQAVLRQDPAAIVRAVVVHLPLAAVLGAACLGLVQVTVAATDVLSSDVAASSGFSPGALMAQLAGGVNGSEPSAPPLVALVLAVLLGAASLALWLELLLRSAAILAATMFMPLALAGLVWPATTVWARRLAETLLSLILSKLVMVAILALGASAMVSGGRHFQVASLLSGAALLLMATFAPFVLLQLVPFVESGAMSHLEGARRRALRVIPGAASWGYGMAQMAGGDDAILDESEDESYPPLAEPTGMPADFEALLASEGMAYVGGEVRRIPPVPLAPRYASAAASSFAGSQTESAGTGPPEAPAAHSHPDPAPPSPAAPSPAAPAPPPSGGGWAAGTLPSVGADAPWAPGHLEAGESRGPEPDGASDPADRDPWFDGEWWTDSGE